MNVDLKAKFGRRYKSLRFQVSGVKKKQTLKFSNHDACMSIYLIRLTELWHCEIYIFASICGK